jgi:hypothetical protein
MKIVARFGKSRIDLSNRFTQGQSLNDTDVPIVNLLGFLVNLNAILDRGASCYNQAYVR